MMLWRYILRAHAGPFVFSNAIIIFLFLLQFLMKSAGDLVGKGLSVWVILELIALNLAWMLVLAVPMSALVASVMAFGRLSADNETVIMRASGMSFYRMLVPVLAAAGLVTWGLISFNNDVLPDANIRLRTLMTDIVRIKPTLALRAGVFTTDEELPNYRILVRRTYEKSNALTGVTIYDLSRPEKNVVVTAEEGRVSFSADYTKVFMDLERGEIHELSVDDMTAYRTLAFVRHRVVIPASGFGFQRSDASTAQRDDRTMDADMMRTIVDSIAVERARKTGALVERVRAHVASYLHGLPVFAAPAPAVERSVAAPDGTSRNPVPDRDSTILPPASPHPAFTALDSADAVFRARLDLRQLQSMISADVASIGYDDAQMNKYLVEVYKKYSIPFACLVFVLVGAPLGMMARRGGFGVGAGLSLGFFLFYWACLIGGEKLADRTVLSPFWGMWAANIVLGACGVWLTVRAARETPAIDWDVLSRLVPKALRAPAGGAGGR